MAAHSKLAQCHTVLLKERFLIQPSHLHDILYLLTPVIRTLCFHIRHAHGEIVWEQVHSDPVHRPADILRSRLYPVIMIADKTCDLLDRIIVKLQPVHDPACNLLTHQGVPAEMIPPVFIRGLHHRLSHVMEEHCETQDLIPLHIFHRPQCMVRHVILMMGRMLCHSHHRVPLRKYDPRDPEFISVLKPLRMSRYKQLYQLGPDPLRADILQCGGKLSDRSRRVRLDREIQLRREADCSQDTEGILRKSLLRIPDTADQMMVQVLHPAEYVDQPDVIIIRHRIDRKITALQIFLQPIRKPDLFRMTAVFICAVNTVCRDLKAVFSHNDSYGPVLDPGVHSPPKQLFDLLGLCRGRDIPVLRTFCQDRISDAPAHCESLVAVKLQIIDDHHYFSWQNYLHVALPSFT